MKEIIFLIPEEICSNSLYKKAINSKELESYPLLIKEHPIVIKREKIIKCLINLQSLKISDPNQLK